MRNLKIHYARAKNILCFGPDGFELHFDDHDNVVEICGINLDNPGSNGYASNGAGKSSIQEILSIGFYGRTVKSPTKLKGGQFINAAAEKAEIEIIWDDYRLVRTFTKSASGSIAGKLHIWQSANHIWDDSSKLKEGKATQKYLEATAIGMSHHAFCNIVIFDDSSNYAFLESDTPTKREFVENLLGLGVYRGYFENAKKLLKQLKDRVTVLAREYDLLQNEVEASTRRLQTIDQQEKTWKTTRQNEIQELIKRVQTKQLQLEKSDTGEQLANWQKAQDRMAALTDQVTELESKAQKVQEAILGAREKVELARHSRDTQGDTVQEQFLALKEIQSSIDTQFKLIEKLERLEHGTRCPYCHGVISKENYGNVLNQSQNVLAASQTELATKKLTVEEHKAEYGKRSATLTSMESRIGEAEAKVSLMRGHISKHRNEITELSAIRRPDGNTQEQVLEAEIVALKKQYKAKQEELDASPYKEIAVQAQVELTEKKQKAELKSAEIKAAEKEIPYYQFWFEAFGDKGIRKYVVDGIIPALNARVTHWLSVLIEGRLELKFDNELEATITRNGTLVDYYAMSNGERRRINLAVSQAFAYVMMLNSGCCPSIVFLDEITGGGIDRAGTVGIYNMIFELAKERQVFVTTHNESLMAMLEGCETLTLRKQNDISILAA
jgi:DNA repair exonuclease SbcCD ATPase subunit